MTISTQIITNTTKGKERSFTWGKGVPDPDLREQLGVSDGEVHALQSWGVGRRDVQHHVLQVLSIASQPVLQALDKHAGILQGHLILQLLWCLLIARGVQFSQPPLFILKNMVACNLRGPF